MKYLWAVLSLVAVFIGASAKAAAPDNDDFVNSVTVSGQNALVSGSNVNATDEPLLANNVSTLAPDTFFPYSTGNHSVWYSWTPAISGSTTISTTGTTFDTTLTVFTGDSTNTLTYVDYDDDSGPGLDSMITISAVAGVTYRIAVDSFSDVTGYFSLAVQQTSDAFSDNFSTATPIIGTSFVISGSNDAATAETGEPSHAGKAAAKSVWLQWTAPGHGNVKLSTAGSLFNTVVSVYTGTALNNLHPIAQNDNENFLITTSALGFTADEGVTYYIAIDGAFAQSGYIQLALDFVPAAPGVEKLQNQIVLNGNTATFTAVASGTGTISYQWERAVAGSKFWTPLVDGLVTDPSSNDDGVTYGGSTTASLTVATKADQSLPTNNDQFRCVVTDSIGTTTSSSAKTIVTVLDTVAIAVRGTTPGGNPIDLTTGGNTGDSYYAKGLPSGLTLDPLTGLVTGTVTARPGTYIVSYWNVTGTVQSTPLTLVINVTPLDSTISGGFEAILEVFPTPNVPTGKVTLLVNATTGVFTGTLVCSDPKAYPLKGALSVNTTYTIATASVTINRKGATPYRVDITLDSTQPVNNRFSVALQQLDASYALVSTIGESSTGIQLATFTTASPPAWQGYYTMILDDPTNPPTPATPPEGTGFATILVKEDTGLFRLRGKLGDNTSLTATLHPSTDGGYRWYGKPYKTGGYFGGWLQFEPIAGGIAPYQMVGAADSELYWQKAPSSSKDKSYRAGFGPILIAATAQLWTPPASGVPLKTALHLTTSTGQLISSFSTTDIPLVDQPLLPTVVTLNNSQKDVFVKTPPANLDKFKMRLNPSTGLFATSYMTLQDGRKITISGALLQQPASVSTGDVIGEGLFLIPPTTKGGEIVTGKIQFTSP